MIETATGVLAATSFIGLLTLAVAMLLGLAARRFAAPGDTVVEQVNALLPQTQCGQCGHPGCLLSSCPAGCRSPGR